MNSNIYKNVCHNKRPSQRKHTRSGSMTFTRSPNAKHEHQGHLLLTNNVYHVPCSGKSLLLNPTLMPNSPSVGMTQFCLLTSQ